MIIRIYFGKITSAIACFLTRLTDLFAMNPTLHSGKRIISVAYKKSICQDLRSDQEDLADGKEDYFLLRDTPDQRANLKVILRAFQSAILKHSKLIIVTGTKAEVVIIEQQVRSKNVTVLACSNDDLLGYLYFKAFGFINCSLTEISKLTIIRARESSCLLVLSDINAFRELVPNKATFFDPGSVTSAIAAIWIVSKKNYKPLPNSFKFMVARLSGLSTLM